MDNDERDKSTAGTAARTFLMNSTWFNWLLVGEYLIMSVWNLYEGHYYKAYYWFGAAIISSSIAIMP